VEEIDAIESVRKIASLGAGVPYRTYRVQMLDHPGQWYYLLAFGEPTATLALAVINGASGDLESWVRTDGARGHVRVDAAEAARLSGLQPHTSVQMAWRPCRASRSPFYPLWEVRSDDGLTRYVNQQGEVWHDL
jgi:hypothetical protein